MIGWLPHSTNPVYAGTRIRCLTPLRHLQARGLPIELFDVRKAGSYRTLIVQGLCFRPDPDRPDITGKALLELLGTLHAGGCRIILEDCDNHFYNPASVPAQAQLAEFIRHAMKFSSRIVASTAGVADIFRTQAEDCPPISIVGDAVEEWSDINFESPWRRYTSWSRKLDGVRLLQLRSQIAEERRRNIRQLVWFGSNGSSYADGGMRDVLRLQTTLEAIQLLHPITLSIISNSEPRYRELFHDFRVPTRYFEWSRASFLQALALHDIAVIPIAKTAFTICKSNNRLLLALSSGLAVCADSIPAYEPFREFCVLDDWSRGLSQYIGSADLRNEHCRAAKMEIQRSWNSSIIANQWQQVILSVHARLH